MESLKTLIKFCIQFSGTYTNAIVIMEVKMDCAVSMKTSFALELKKSPKRNKRIVNGCIRELLALPGQRFSAKSDLFEGVLAVKIPYLAVSGKSTFFLETWQQQLARVINDEEY